MRLKALRFGLLHRDPELLDLSRWHRVIGELPLLQKGQKVALIDCAIDCLVEARLHVLIVVVLDRFQQQVSKRPILKKFTQNVVNPSAQSLACCFQLF